MKLEICGLNRSSGHMANTEKLKRIELRASKPLKVVAKPPAQIIASGRFRCGGGYSASMRARVSASSVTLAAARLSSMR